MTCDEFQKQIDDAIDRRLDSEQLAALTEQSAQASHAAADGFSDPDLAGHAAGCAMCRERWQDFLLLDQAVAEWRARPLMSPPDEDFTNRVLRDVRAAGLGAAGTEARSDAVAKPATPVAQTLRPVRAWEVLVTVALVLIAVVAVFRDGSSELAKEDTAPLPSSPFEAPQDDELVDLTDLLSDARVALSSLTERASERAKLLRVFVPDVSSDLDFGGSSYAPINPAPTERTPRDADGAADDSESNGNDNQNSDSLQRAIDFLFDVAGPAEEQTT